MVRIDAGVDDRDHRAGAVRELLRLGQVEHTRRRLADIVVPHTGAVETRQRGIRQRVEDRDRRFVELRAWMRFRDRRAVVRIEVLDVRIGSNRGDEIVLRRARLGRRAVDCWLLSR